ncbi:MAG: YihA family ribosome biogenesis GTP-binding protein [Polaromonas sp.]|nr:YihA family ribosome biogenesis GTP-binding protein [Polaromonas sp.]
MTSPTSLPLAAAAMAPDPKIAMGWLHTAKFLTTAPELKHLPRIEVPEIAFVGRSNAGKSTCINTLTQQHRLAFASKTPGRTQSINLFSLGKQGITDAVLADLPGYGYAAVPKEAKYRWQQVMGNYLQTRDNLQAIVLLCAPRLGLTELDEVLLDVIRPRVEAGLKFLVLLTKSDKLNRADAAKALQIVKLQAGGGDVKLFSSLKRQGVEEVAQHLWDWAHPKEKPEKPVKAPRVAPDAEAGQTDPESRPDALDPAAPEQPGH